MAYQLKNEQLMIDIAEIGEYGGSRFDWSGFITGVTLINGERGSHTYCVPESLTAGEGTGGEGLCNEFGLRKAIGYDDAKVGEQFPKLGIGLLTRPDDEEYAFDRAYPIRPFQVHVEQENACKLVFRGTQEPCKGFSAHLTKSIAIHNNRLTVEYELHNTGMKEICTEEYCHNFIGIDEQPVGPDYVLKFPYVLNPWSDDKETLDDLVFRSEAGLGIVGWRKKPDKPFYFRQEGFEGAKYAWLWELIHQPSGVGVRELSTFSVSDIAVWGQGHVISPEIFIEVKVAPGERKSWSRVYEFFIES
ncbi:hypothetical protein D3C74_167920 [compost metagenome]